MRLGGVGFLAQRNELANLMVKLFAEGFCLCGVLKNLFIPVKALLHETQLGLILGNADCDLREFFVELVLSIVGRTCCGLSRLGEFHLSKRHLLFRFSYFDWADATSAHIGGLFCKLKRRRTQLQNLLKIP